MKKKIINKFLSIHLHNLLRCLIIIIISLLYSTIYVFADINENNENYNQSRITVVGIITDSDGNALAGVSILEKNTVNGTISDTDGRYTLNVPEDAILVFSFVGMETAEIAVNRQTNINIRLIQSVLSLDDVVVVGYGKLRNNQISSSISRVTSSEIADRPVARIDQAIQGKIAGIQVQEISGSPGRSLSVLVRGNNSINYGSSPLYVVDGFPISGNLDNISPGDIQSIEVLKDAASASIYGSRGSNGVILITTKSGNKGKNVIELDSYFGLQTRFSKVDVLNKAEYLEYAIEERTNSYLYSGGDPSVPEDQRHNYKFAIDPLWRTNPESFPDHDWQALVDRVAPIHSYTLSASGGTDRLKYFISNNYFDQQGIILNSNYKRYSARANVEANINKYLTLGINLSASTSKRNDPDTDTNQGPISRSILVAPIVGINEQTVDGGYYYYHAHFFLNPIALAKEVVNESKDNNFISNVYGEISILKNLKLRSSFGTNILSHNNDYYKNNNVNRGTGSVANSSNSYRQNYLTENTLTYDLSEDDFTLNLLGGFTYQEENYKYLYLAKTGFPDDEIKTLNAGTVLSSGTSTAEKWSIISYLSRANLSFKDKYIFTASIRRDGSSRFGKDNRWGFFPSASIGWILSDEPFMNFTKDAISNLKLRASYGVVGNNNIGNYSSIGLMSSTNYIIGTNKLGGYSPSSFSNSNLGWERTSTIDAGVDMGFIKNRINLTFDYYISNTNDLLLQVQIPQITGFGTALQNIGKVQNKGIELELLTKNLVGVFSWTTSFNISHNRNEVKELGPDKSPIISYSNGFPLTITRIGDPIGSYYMFETDGVFKDQEDVEENGSMAYISPNPSPGDLKYKDQNNDGLIDAVDKVIVGHNNPDFFWGLTNTFEYKGFSLSLFMDGQWGNKLLNLGKKETTQSRGNVRGYWRDRWRSEEQPGNGRVPRAVTTENLTTPSDWWLEDASFWRIRSINFGYNIPEAFIIKIPGISGLRIYSGIDNVYMYDHYNHMAQTAAYANSNLLPGLDYDSGYPLATTYKVGINIKF